MNRERLVESAGVPKLGDYLSSVDELLISDARQAGQLSHLLNKMVQRKGKRLRPILLILSTGLNTLEQTAVQAAAAVEAVHLASLAHDWIIDNQAEKHSKNDLLLAGDYFLARGLALAAAVSGQAAKCLAEAIAKMADGQKQQFLGSYQADSASKLYAEVISKKTAALFEAACVMGAQLSGNNASIGPLAKYGNYFGMEFQIIDDIKDGEFRNQKIPLARQAATKYANLASRQLAKLPPSQANLALAKLPTAYLADKLP